MFNVLSLEILFGNTICSGFDVTCMWYRVLHLLKYLRSLTTETVFLFALYIKRTNASILSIASKLPVKIA